MILGLVVVRGGELFTGAGTGNGGGGVCNIFERRSGGGNWNDVGGGGRNGEGIKPDELFVVVSDDGGGKKADCVLNGGGGNWARVWKVKWSLLYTRKNCSYLDWMVKEA